MVGHLHDKEREELVLLVHLPCGHWVTVVVVGKHHQPSIGADEEEAADTNDIPPDSSGNI